MTANLPESQKGPDNTEDFERQQSVHFAGVRVRF